MSAILPDGLSLVDAPYPLTEAILSGLHLTGLDEWPEEDRPPKRIWLDEPAMRAHFEQVKQRHTTGAGGGDGAMSDNKAAEDLLFG